MVTSTVIKSRLRAILSFLFILLTTVALGQGGKKEPPPPPDPGRGATIWGFEVDADFRANFIPSFWTPTTTTNPDYNPVYYPNLSTFGVDWRSLLNYSGTTHKFTPKITGDKRTTGSVDGNWGNQSQVPEVISFAGTSNKNGDLIGTGQSPYYLQFGGSGPQKNDITNTFLHSRDYNDSTVLVYAVETRATNGASYLDFEYNQAGVHLDTLDGHLDLIGNGPNGGRTPGDFILVVDYIGGGTTPIVSARVWQATGATTGQWGDSIGIDRLRAYIAANTLDVEALSTSTNNLSSYADNGAPSATTKALQMVEGAINITYLMGTIQDFQDLNLCSPNATVTVKTRSSPSFTSELKDLDVIPFSIIPGPPGTNTSQIACPDTIGGTYATFDLTDVSSIVVGAGGHVVKWYKDVSFTEPINDSLAYKAANGTVVFAQLANAEGCISTAADTLKVRTSPGKPATFYIAPACDQATFSVKVKPATVGYDYFIRNKNGGLISGVLPGDSVRATLDSVMFTNIPAGSGYRIRVKDANGCPSAPDSCGVPSGTPAWITKADKPANEEKVQTTETVDVLANIDSKAKVLAAPNPFTDKVRFTLQSAVTGQGSLEIYNMVGQKVATVYQGYIEAGKPMVKEYLVPRAQRANLIYVFRVGDQRATGKLINK